MMAGEFTSTVLASLRHVFDFQSSLTQIYLSKDIGKKNTDFDVSMRNI